MLTRWVPSLFRRSAGPSRLHPLQPIGKCFFGKTRIVVEGSTKTPTTHTVELNPFNKLRTVSKRTGLPSSHILKALCTREGKSFYLKDSEGIDHCFQNERDVVLPYSILEPYLMNCKKTCRCVEIDPENEENTCMETNNMGLRQSVFSVVGEMDHGKTTLLDYLQHSAIQKQEFGGTTQLIRANQVALTSSQSESYPCTILDTPGQSCFSNIRENGSVLSDLSIYVVSLSEGPSEEARTILSQLKENGVPVVVVFTKSDLVSEDRKNSIRSQLLHLADELSVPIVDTFTISCVSGEGIPHLQQRLVELGKESRRSVPLDVPAEASVLDSLLIPSQGLVLRALVQQGTLHVRDEFVCGLFSGRVRSLVDLKSRAVQTALPGTVVNVLGARKLPAGMRRNGLLLPSGHTLFVRSAKEIEAIKEQRMLEYAFQSSRCATEAEDAAEYEAAVSSGGEREVVDGEEYVAVKKQPVIVVADNANSLNILLEALSQKPLVSIVRTRVGQILESDVQECEQSEVRLVSFNVEAPPKARLGKKLVYSRLMSELLEEVQQLFDWRVCWCERHFTVAGWNRRSEKATFDEQTTLHLDWP